MFPAIEYADSSDGRLHGVDNTFRPRIAKESTLIMRRLQLASVQNYFAMFINDYWYMSGISRWYGL